LQKEPAGLQEAAEENRRRRLATLHALPSIDVLRLLTEIERPTPQKPAGSEYPEAGMTAEEEPAMRAYWARCSRGPRTEEERRTVEAAYISGRRDRERESAARRAAQMAAPIQWGEPEPVSQAWLDRLRQCDWGHCIKVVDPEVDTLCEKHRTESDAPDPEEEPTLSPYEAHNKAFSDEIARSEAEAEKKAQAEREDATARTDAEMDVPEAALSIPEVTARRGGITFAGGWCAPSDHAFSFLGGKPLSKKERRKMKKARKVAKRKREREVLAALKTLGDYVGVGRGSDW
jgi:hypothetical protein